MRVARQPDQPGQIGGGRRQPQRQREMDDRRMKRMAEQAHQIRWKTPPARSRKPTTATPAWAMTAPLGGDTFRAWYEARKKPASAATTRIKSAVGTIFATSVEPPSTTIAVSTRPVAPSAA